MAAGGLFQYPAKGTRESFSQEPLDEGRGGKVRNIYRKVKKNVHKTLSPASVDKSVHKVALPPKYRAFLHLQDVFA
jgi:hypothetical protein